MNLDEYRKRGLHLPPELRDFHGQKDLFKALFGTRKVNDLELSWVDQHVYVIDYFLWIMAAYGYELRRTKRMVERKSITEAVKKHREEQSALFLEELKKISRN